MELKAKIFSADKSYDCVVTGLGVEGQWFVSPDNPQDNWVATVRIPKAPGIDLGVLPIAITHSLVQSSTENILLIDPPETVEETDWFPIKRSRFGELMAKLLRRPQEYGHRITTTRLMDITWRNNMPAWKLAMMDDK